MRRRRYKARSSNTKLIKATVKLLLTVIAKTLAFAYIVIYSIFSGLFYMAKYIRNYKVIKSTGYSLDKIESMITKLDGRQFEIFVQELFKALGYAAKATKYTKDGGKDVIARKDGEVTYIEAKRWKAKSQVGREILQKLVGAAVADGADRMILICTCRFNNNAYEYAAKVDNLELWDMKDIMRKLLTINPHKVPRIIMKSMNSKSSSVS